MGEKLWLWWLICFLNPRGLTVEWRDEGESPSTHAHTSFPSPAASRCLLEICLVGLCVSAIVCGCDKGSSGHYQRRDRCNNICVDKCAARVLCPISGHTHTKKKKRGRQGGMI